MPIEERCNTIINGDHSYASIMKGAALLTPGNVLALAIGGIICVSILMFVFKKKK